MPTIKERFRELGLEWPSVERPDLPFAPAKRVGGIVYVSGQIPERGPDVVVTGRVGREVDVEAAKRAAALCAANVVFWLDELVGGDLDRIEQVAKVTVYVNAVEGFTRHSEVGNGASELFRAVFGARGDHARAALGMGGLPLDVPVEVDAIVHVR